jgi:hypothetical protein
MSIEGFPSHAESPMPEGSPTRLRIRQQLGLQDGGLRLIREHLGRAVPQMDVDASARLAIDEILSHVGGRLGFTSRRDDAEDVDVWTSPTGLGLAVAPMGPPEVAAGLRDLGRARDRLLVARGLPARRLTVLAVICGSLVNWRQIEDEAAVRRAHDYLRVIGLDALLSLLEARAGQSLAHTDALLVLRPQSVRADGLVEILTRKVRVGSNRGQAGVSPGTELLREPGQGSRDMAAPHRPGAGRQGQTRG